MQSPKANRFAGQHLLTAAGQMPESLAAALARRRAHDRRLDGGHRHGRGGGPAPHLLRRGIAHRGAASGSHRASPSPAAIASTSSGSPPRAGGATVAWIESWYDTPWRLPLTGRGRPTSAPARSRARSRAADRLASGSELRRQTAPAIRRCPGSRAPAEAACTTEVATRAANQTFGPARALGAGRRRRGARRWRSGPPARRSSAGSAAAGPVAAVQPGPGPRIRRGSTRSRRTTYAADITVAATGPGTPRWRRGRRAR